MLGNAFPSLSWAYMAAGRADFGILLVGVIHQVPLVPQSAVGEKVTV